MLATVDAYNVSLFIHITAVMVGFGSTFALSVTTPIALKLSPRHLPYVHELEMTLNRFFASPALILVLATGIYQVSAGGIGEAWKFSQFWVSATFAILIVIGGIMGAVFMPSSRRMKVLADRDIEAAGEGTVTMSDEYNQLAKRGAIFGPITGPSFGHRCLPYDNEARFVGRTPVSQPLSYPRRPALPRVGRLARAGLPPSGPQERECFVVPRSPSRRRLS